ncbi:MAG: CPBP family intramembrane metalloprotease [Lachnospiraceae bacterium]|nr:CPBP family intramembrane metalloprotease [Lachnospiraceae bacterium]
MNFWRTFSCRWDEEELKKWPSLKKTAYLLLPLLVYYAVHDMAEVVLWMLLNFIVTSGGEKAIAVLNRHGPTLQGMIYGLSILAGTAVIWPAVKREISGPLSGTAHQVSQTQNGAGGKALTDAGKMTAYRLLAAFAYCAAVSLNIFFTQTGFTGSSETYEEIYELQYGVQFAVGLVLYGIISPLAEEAVFRGLLYNRMKRCFNYKTALVFSSLLFGIYHGNIVQAVYGSILGLLIAYFYEQYGSFAVPVLFHGVANVGIYAMTYRNVLADMDRKIALTMGTIFFAGAVFLFFYIQRKCLGREGH